MRKGVEQRLGEAEGSSMRWCRADLEVLRYPRGAELGEWR